MVRVTAGPAGARFDRVDPPGDPVQAQFQPPRAALGAGQTVAQGFGQIADGSRDIFLAAQGFGKGSAQPPDRGRCARGNRFVDLPESLIEPSCGQFPEASCQSGAGQGRQIGNVAQAQPVKAVEGIGRQSQRGNR